MRALVKLASWFTVIILSFAIVSSPTLAAKSHGKQTKPKTNTTKQTVNKPAPAVTANYNVRDFGARADGKTDDTKAIQKALDQAELTGGTVYIPQGTYLIDPAQTLYVGAKTQLTGDGERSVLRAKTNSFGWELLRVDGSNSTISDIVLDGNNRVNRIAVIAGGTSNVTLKGVKLLNATHSTDKRSSYYEGVVAGLIIYGNTTGITVDQAEIAHIQALNPTSGNLIARGIHITTTWNSKEAASRQLTIRNSYIHHIGPADDGDGIYFEDPNLDLNRGQDTNSTISNNRFDYTAKRAIKIYAQGVTVSDNEINNPYLNNNYYQADNRGKLAPDMFSAISIYASNQQVVNNKITGAGSFYAAIEVGVDETLSNIHIASNSITMGPSSKTAGTTAIRLGNIQNFSVTGNTIVNGERAIWTWQNATNGEISRNVIRMPAGGGIDLSSYVKNVTQRNIVCEYNTLDTKTFSIQTAKSNIQVKVLAN